MNEKNPKLWRKISATLKLESQPHTPRDEDSHSGSCQDKSPGFSPQRLSPGTRCSGRDKGFSDGTACKVSHTPTTTRPGKHRSRRHHRPRAVPPWPVAGAGGAGSCVPERPPSIAPPGHTYSVPLKMGLVSNGEVKAFPRWSPSVHTWAWAPRRQSSVHACPSEDGGWAATTPFLLLHV